MYAPYRLDDKCIPMLPPLFVYRNYRTFIICRIQVNTMELRDIEYFAVVAEHGNVRRAAEALDLSPPALSKSLRRLEKSVGAKLVKRTPKGVELTDVGVAMVGQVRRI